MMGQTKEAEKMTNHIVTEEAECLECYRLLSAIYSKQENYNKVQMSLWWGSSQFMYMIGERRFVQLDMALQS